VLTWYSKCAIILSTMTEIKKKTKRYAFQVYFNRADSERFEAFARESGMKKLAIVHKALLRYLDEEEQKAGN